VDVTFLDVAQALISDTNEDQLNVEAAVKAFRRSTTHSGASDGRDERSAFG